MALAQRGVGVQKPLDDEFEVRLPHLSGCAAEAEDSWACGDTRHRVRCGILILCVEDRRLALDGMQGHVDRDELESSGC
jgi:hypothetical protein